MEHYGESSHIVFTAGQIAFPLGYLLSGYLSDRFRMLRNLLIFSLALHGPTQFLLFSITDNLWFSILLNAFNRFLVAMNMQLMSIVVLEGAGSVRFGLVRSYGSMGFFTIQIILYLMTFGPLDYLMPVKSDGGYAGILGSFLFPLALIPALFVQKDRKSRENYFIGEAFRILLSWKVILFFTLSFFYFFSYQLVDFYLGDYFKQIGGIKQVFAGWSIAVAFETPLLMFSGFVYRHRGIRILFLLSLVSGIIRFALLSISSAGFWSGAPILSQFLHGIHFGGYYMGAIYWLRRVFPDHLYGTVYGAYIILTGALGGSLGSIFFGRMLYQGFWLNGIRYFWVVEGDHIHFLPLFITAMAIHLILFISFLFITDPEKRIV